MAALLPRFILLLLLVAQCGARRDEREVALVRLGAPGWHVVVVACHRAPSPPMQPPRFPRRPISRTLPSSMPQPLPLLLRGPARTTPSSAGSSVAAAAVHGARTQVPPPFGHDALRRRLTEGAGAAQDLPPPPPDTEHNEEDGNPQQQAVRRRPRVPVILAVAFGGPAVVVTADSRVIDASAVNTTRCIRYAKDFNPADPAQQPEPGARPPLNLQRCRRSVLPVAMSGPSVTIQVGW